MPSRRRSRSRARRYPAFRRLDGTHPFRKAAAGGFVDYRARRVAGTEVVWFHFPLAAELGLLPSGHPHRMNGALRAAILDTFGLVIINEYDMEHGLRLREGEMRPGLYMATRYLQLQHPDRRGTTSGDGRGIWNGIVRHDGRTWDISSLGTGVTSLCPATAESQQFFRTANDDASYGCGTAALDEAFERLLMSETFHRNGIPTERVLAILKRPDGYAIVVRAAPSLIRPAHLFVHLRQGNLPALRGLVEHTIRREVQNGAFPRLRRRADRSRFLAEETARRFARAAATFESEYIFCWLDWDGDNILANGGIIDYGSVRQFGLYHREYRFDDGPRMSTTLPEQRRKARLIVQNFAQIRDFLRRGRRAPLRSFARDPILALFDATFAATRRHLLLRNIGFPAAAQEALLARDAGAIESFRRAHAYFERARSARGPQPVADGLTWNAIFSARDLRRELPRRYLEHLAPVSAGDFLQIALSTYASREDARLTPHRRRMAGLFQRHYLDLLQRAARHTGTPVPRLLAEVAGRAAVINRYARITGDSIAFATQRLLRARRHLTTHQLQRIVERFVGEQVLIPDLQPATDRPTPEDPMARRVLADLEELQEEHREGL